ncbi:MAG: nucleotidyl transferase AbiEii/AbiGii toxin family protein [Verrucomicrobia bacterium]|nr:nucleotidyl transferase AbiEii/AbiGii toxin family protein [Verrucomicrobiota bacterium]
MLVVRAFERFLYRLSASKHGKDFVLKGATLFTLWEGFPHRQTRDVDPLGFGDKSTPPPKEVEADNLLIPTKIQTMAGAALRSSSIKTARGLSPTLSAR